MPSLLKRSCILSGNHGRDSPFVSPVSSRIIAYIKGADGGSAIAGFSKQCVLQYKFQSRSLGGGWCFAERGSCMLPRPAIELSLLHEAISANTIAHKKTRHQAGLQFSYRLQSALCRRWRD